MNEVTIVWEEGKARLQFGKTRKASLRRNSVKKGPESRNPPCKPAEGKPRDGHSRETQGRCGCWNPWGEERCQGGSWKGKEG